jgi:hypothetical protein
VPKFWQPRSTSPGSALPIGQERSSVPREIMNPRAADRDQPKLPIADATALARSAERSFRLALDAPGLTTDEKLLLFEAEQRRRRLTPRESHEYEMALLTRQGELLREQLTRRLQEAKEKEDAASKKILLPVPAVPKAPRCEGGQTPEAVRGVFDLSAPNVRTRRGGGSQDRANGQTLGSTAGLKPGEIVLVYEDENERTKLDGLAKLIRPGRHRDGDLRYWQVEFLDEPGQKYWAWVSASDREVDNRREGELKLGDIKMIYRDFRGQRDPDGHAKLLWEDRESRNGEYQRWRVEFLTAPGEFCWRWLSVPPRGWLRRRHYD